MDVRPNGMAPKREKGKSFVPTRDGVPGTAYSPRGRVICHQIAEAIVKQTDSKPDAKVVRTCSPYRVLYDVKKAQYQSNAGNHVRRGPSNCPFGQTHKDAGGAVIACGDGHAHAAAMRYAVKCLLRDMWVEWQHTMPARAA